MVAALGIAENVVAMAALWLAAGAGSAFIWAGLNTLAVQSAPENRGGAISVVGAFKFAGSAIGPLVWLPLYLAHVKLAFATAGAACAAIALVVLGLRGGPRAMTMATSERARATAAAARQ
jgi:MFS family permease